MYREMGRAEFPIELRLSIVTYRYFHYFYSRKGGFLFCLSLKVFLNRYYLSLERYYIIEIWISTLVETLKKSSDRIVEIFYALSIPWPIGIPVFFNDNITVGKREGSWEGKRMAGGDF